MNLLFFRWWISWRFLFLVWVTSSISSLFNGCWCHSVHHLLGHQVKSLQLKDPGIIHKWIVSGVINDWVAWRVKLICNITKFMKLSIWSGEIYTFNMAELFFICENVSRFWLCNNLKAIRIECNLNKVVLFCLSRDVARTSLFLIFF